MPLPSVSESVSVSLAAPVAVASASAGGPAGACLTSSAQVVAASGFAAADAAAAVTAGAVGGAASAGTTTGRGGAKRTPATAGRAMPLSLPRLRAGDSGAGSSPVGRGAPHPPPPPHLPTSRGSHDRSDRGSAARMGDTDRPRPERGGGSPRPSAGADDGAAARRWGEGVRPAGTAAVSAATAALRLPSPPPPSSSEGAALAAEDEHPVATDTADPTDSNDEGVANHAPEPPAARPLTPPRVSSARPPLASPPSRLPSTTPAPLHQSPQTSTRSPRSLGGGGGRATAAAAAGVASSPQPSPAIAMTGAAAADHTSKPARPQRVRPLKSPRAGGGEKIGQGCDWLGAGQWAARMRNTGRPSARPQRV